MIGTSHYGLQTFRVACSFLGFDDYAQVVGLMISSFMYILGTMLFGYLWEVLSIKNFVLMVYVCFFVSMGL